MVTPNSEAETETLLAGEPAPAREVLRHGGVPRWLYQLALATVQVTFVVGAVVLKRGMQQLTSKQADRFHPLLFVFYRTSIATPLLLGVAVYLTGRWLPHRRDMPRVALLGMCLFLNQGLYILGLKASGALVASCLQPAIPVFTHMLAVLAGYEAAYLRKGLGIVLAVAGAVCMVLRNPGPSVDGAHPLLGNLSLLGNTLSMAAYFIVVKGLSGAYKPINITAWAYVSASACLALVTAATVPAPDLLLPAPLLGPLVYWILGCSVFAYFTMTSATKYLPPSEVASFQCLQPLVGTVLSVVVLRERPTWWDLGALGVLGGLMLVTSASHPKPPSARQQP